MAPVERDSMNQLRAAKARVEELEHSLERARAGYHEAIGQVHREGASLRELASGLGISHQRIHQIVGPAHSAPAPIVTSPLVCCDFCGCDRDEHVPFVPGPGVGICGICLDAAEQAVDGTHRSTLGVMFHRADPNSAECCAFCKKRARQVNRLVATDDVAVCDECMSRCRGILARRTANV